jgi:hypothetical protein
VADTVTTFHWRAVKRARKQRQCTWCAEHVDVGQPYESYRWSEDGSSVVLHPECSKAMELLNKQDPDFMWVDGEFFRGSTHCRCDHEPHWLKTNHQKQEQTTACTSTSPPVS